MHTTVSRLAGEDAPDVTHDAFMQAFERAGAYRGDGPLAAWIARIGVNLALRRLRRGRLARGFLARAAEPVTAAPAAAEAVALDLAVRRLPDTLRSVFVLHALEGYPHDEVAGMLGISEASSRQRLRRARLALAESLGLEARQ